jgi:poly-gamma-glutamate capsule biosynthesis protein CapA/YwtB (metallophosphatase superfamily)
MSDTATATTATTDRAADNELQFTLVGDTMLGRLVDQFFPTHIETASEDSLHASFWKQRHADIAEKYQSMGHKFVWGNTLDFFLNSDVNIINLETSITTNTEKDPKEFNYQMHPDNVRALLEARVHYCSLANNHTLDFKVKGMFDTMKHLTDAGIAWAGVGKNRDEAYRPALLRIKDTNIACYSFSDHYQRWAAGPNRPGINYLDPEQCTDADIQKLKDNINAVRADIQRKGEDLDVVVLSYHWGSNYNWRPPKEFQRLAHRVIDECGVTLIHGHSAHHVQGVEVYHGIPIIYGCGDFVDDYAVDSAYRNNLGFVYRLRWDKLNKQWTDFRLHPTKIAFFSVSTRMWPSERQWLVDKVTLLSQEMGTQVSLVPPSEPEADESEAFLRVALPT